MTAEVLGDVVPMYPEAETTAEDYESWDAFWAEVRPPRLTTIRGVTVRVPHGLTLSGQQLIHARTGSDLGSWAPIIVDLLRGPDGETIPDLWDQWRAGGMELTEMSVVVTWAMANAQGSPISFRDAYQRVTAGGKDESTSPPTETASSAATGGRSRPRSGRRTASQGADSPT